MKNWIGRPASKFVLEQLNKGREEVMQDLSLGTWQLLARLGKYCEERRALEKKLTRSAVRIHTRKARLGNLKKRLIPQTADQLNEVQSGTAW